MTKKQTIKVLEKAGEYMIVKDDEFIKGTGNGFFLAAELLKGRVIGDVLPMFMPKVDE